MTQEAIVIFDPVSSSAFLKPIAREMGFKVVEVFTKPLDLFTKVFHTTQKVLFSDSDETIISESKEEIVQKLKQMPLKIKAAITGIDSGALLADQICEALNLWGNDIALSSARTNKGEMRKVLKENGLSCPDFTLCTTEKEATTFATSHSFPLVIKTPQGAAGSHVYVCHNEKELVQNFHAIMDQKDIYGRRAKHAILEEYISGKEYVVDTFHDGEKIYTTDIWVYEKIDTKSAQNVYYNVILLPLEDPALKPFIDYAEKVTRAFGILRGPAHLEIKDDPRKGPTLIEINPRLAGARFQLHLRNHTNFDPYKKTIEVFVHGKTKIPHPIRIKEQCAIAFCPTLEGGKIQSIRGIEEIEKLESYQSHVLNIRIGEVCAPSTDLTTIPLVVYLAHTDRHQLLKDLERAHALFLLRFEAV